MVETYQPWALIPDLISPEEVGKYAKRDLRHLSLLAAATRPCPVKPVPVRGSRGHGKPPKLPASALRLTGEELRGPEDYLAAQRRPHLPLLLKRANTLLLICHFFSHLGFANPMCWSKDKSKTTRERCGFSLLREVLRITSKIWQLQSKRVPKNTKN